MTHREERLFRMVAALCEVKRAREVSEFSPTGFNEEVALQANREVHRCYENLTNADKAEIRTRVLACRDLLLGHAREARVLVDAVKGADLADKGGPLVDYLA